MDGKNEQSNTKKGTRMNANELACEVPLVEMLEGVPKDARFVQEKEFSSTYHPVGRLCHEAATMLRQQQAEIEGLKKQLETSALLNYNKGHEDGRNIALPIKTLADEEIDSIWSEMSEQCDEEFIDMKQFARAILRKAQGL